MCDSPICIHADTCKKHKGNDTGVPLTQRGAVPFCHQCGHVWRFQHSFKKRTCDICKIVKDMNIDSAKIKHTRG